MKFRPHEAIKFDDQPARVRLHGCCRPGFTLPILLAGGLAACSTVYEQQPIANPLVVRGQCDLSEESSIAGKYSRIKRKDLSTCVKFGGSEARGAWTISNPANSFVIESECPVTLKVESKHASPCGKSSPLRDGDQMRVFAMGGAGYKLAFFPKDKPKQDQLLTLESVMVSGADVEGIAAFKSEIEIDSLKYEVFVYLTNHSYHSTMDEIDRYYRVELFAKDESEECLKERPGVIKFTKADCTVDRVVPAENNPDESPRTDRQTGSSSGGDPPRDP